MIPAEAVEAAAKAAESCWNQWGTWEDVALAALEAAAPHMLAGAWAAGHESGFWNGRESTGSGEMGFCGVEHAKVTNPYRPTDAR